jgi:predicted enzyme related to lactoylglutathione lyase
MKENHFVYADLSTYDLIKSQQFYGEVFDWKYYNSGEDYLIAFSGRKEVSGLYETPKKFQEMNMPSFWMSYIQVNHVEETVEIARELGGIIELVDLEASIGKIALIRDPLGAGFTVYEGDMLNARTPDTPNTLVWNELFVSDVSKVKAFYETIFHWKIVPSETDRYSILDTEGMEISAINEVSNAFKGKHEYWSVFFGVKDIVKSKTKALKQGGSLVYEDAYSTVLADSFGAFFHVVKV